MRALPSLTPDFCLRLVISATPHPTHFHKTDDPTEKTLFDLGVVDALSAALFVQNIKTGIAPWHIEDESIQCSRTNTVQQAADSVQTGAFDR